MSYYHMGGRKEGFKATNEKQRKQQVELAYLIFLRRVWQLLNHS